MYFAFVASCGIGHARPSNAAEPDDAPALRTIAVYAVVGSGMNSDVCAYGTFVVLGRGGSGRGRGAGRLQVDVDVACRDRANR